MTLSYGKRIQPAKVLTIAGSDSGGAAGLQADLKTFAALGVYGMCAITAVTAQNSRHVQAVHLLPPDFVAAQIDAVLSDYGAAAVKTGFTGRVELVEQIGRKLGDYETGRIVIDPVLVDHRGGAMFPSDVADAYRRYLLPLADLLTPNRREAELLTGRSLSDLATMRTAVRALHALGPRHVLLKGGRDGDDAVDLFFDGQSIILLRAPWLATDNTHGGGDTLAAAVAAFLAQGDEMATAVRRAHQFTHRAIQAAVDWRLGGGHGPVNPLWANGNLLTA